MHRGIYVLSREKLRCRNLIFELDKGLRIEDRGILLPWHSDLEVLRSLQPSQQSLNRFGHRLIWNDVEILGGLKCSLLVQLSEEAPLKLVEVYPLADDYNGQTLEEAFASIKKQLDTSFQQHSEERRHPSSLADGLDYPEAKWNLPGAKVALSIVENNGAAYIPYLIMTISAL